MNLQQSPSSQSKAPPRGRDAVLRSMDRCTKCGICQAHCPVAAVTDRFPGPKYTGPQAARFRVIDPVRELSPDLCSGCGICTSVCPNDVAITDIITLAKAQKGATSKRLPFRQKLVNRPDFAGRLGGLAPWLANAILSSRLLRILAEKAIGVHRNAPLPRISGPVFRRWLIRRQQPEGPRLTYFSGCAVENYDPQVGKALVRTLNHFGYRVDAPSAACCGLPLLSSGETEGALARADALVAALAPVAGRPIVSTSTSCSLTLKSKYAAYLDLDDGPARAVAGAVFDVAEFLRDRHYEDLARDLRAVPKRVLYHAPCQLRGHGMGVPAAELLGLVPDLDLVVSEADCCGVGGTYGYDRDKYGIAKAVGRTLAEQVALEKPDLLLCDSETCRWHIAAMTGLPCLHPIELIAASLAGEVGGQLGGLKRG